MTLHTRIATLAPFNLRELHQFVNDELLGLRGRPVKIADKDNTRFDRAHFEATRTGQKDARGVEVGERRWVPDGTRELGNEVGQGFAAWFWIDYRPDGWLHPTPVYYDEHYDETYEPVEWAEDGEPPTLHESNPAMCVELNFDTAYGYKHPTGYGCGTLHAIYIARLGAWFDERRIEWCWYNEFTDEWHDGYDGLSGLVDSGRTATDWYQTSVKPLLESIT